MHSRGRHQTAFRPPTAQPPPIRLRDVFFVAPRSVNPPLTEAALARTSRVSLTASLSVQLTPMQGRPTLQSDGELSLWRSITVRASRSNDDATVCEIHVAYSGATPQAFTHPSQPKRAEAALPAWIQAGRKPRDIGIFCFSIVPVFWNLMRRDILRQLLAARTHLSDSNNLILMMQSCRRHKLRLGSAEG